jgi:hypothetical protein
MKEHDAFHPGQVVDAAEFRRVHRDYQKGIYVPAGDATAASIRSLPNADYGYADRWIVEGESLDYTGQGSPPGDQDWNRFNSGLREAEASGSRVHVFEELEGSPKMFRYQGAWRVMRHYEFMDEHQHRKLLRFILEARRDE